MADLKALMDFTNSKKENLVRFLCDLIDDMLKAAQFYAWLPVSLQRRGRG
ncbi:MAG: hypothetical protein AB1798_11665 [Spirochaetota bacterium]